MAVRNGLTGILLALVLSSAGGCVVYRDRVVTVSTQTQVAFEPGTAAVPVQSQQTLPDIPQAPGRLEAPAMHAALDTYGTWTDTVDYGEVWVPQAADDFVPYGSDGQWDYTSAGWYWESSLPWGAVPFHYGRWIQEEGAWAWVPGAVFAPAWVDWRYGNGWVGWSPLGPLGADYAAPYAYCGANALMGPGVWNRVVTGSSAASLYPMTRSVGAAYGYGGAQYSWGPPVAITGLPAGHAGSTVEHLWSSAPGALALSSPRAGAPVPGGVHGSVVGQPVGGPRLPEVPTIASMAPSSAGLHPVTSMAAGGVGHTFAGSSGSGYAFGRGPTGSFAPASGPGTRLQNSVTLGSSWGPTTGRVSTWERFNNTAPRSFSGGGFGAGAPVYSGGHFGPVAPSSAGGVQYRPGPSYGAPSPASRPAMSYAPSVAPSHATSFGGGGFGGGFHGGGGRGGRR